MINGKRRKWESARVRRMVRRGQDLRERSAPFWMDSWDDDTHSKFIKLLGFRCVFLSIVDFDLFSNWILSPNPPPPLFFFFFIQNHLLFSQSEKAIATASSKSLLREVVPPVRKRCGFALSTPSFAFAISEPAVTRSKPRCFASFTNFAGNGTPALVEMNSFPSASRTMTAMSIQMFGPTSIYSLFLTFSWLIPARSQHRS